MKTKRLLLAISVVSFLTILFTSCSQDGDLDIGGSTGTPPPSSIKSVSMQTDSITTTHYLPND